MEAALGSVVDPKLDPELKLKPGLLFDPELKLSPLLEPELDPAPPKLAEVTVTLPAPGVPWNAGRRCCPKISRTGCGESCAKSDTMTRIPNSISRERFNETSVRSAEMRAVR
jgi:hypothetical protein